MRREIVIVCVLATPAIGKPLTAAQQQQVSADLAKGRALQGKKAWPGAIAAFRDALTVAPDDPDVLGELGWTQYLAADLPGAETSTRKSLSLQGQPSTRGATFYNLGLIEEAKHDHAAAVAAYQASLKARPNGVVRRALAKLDPAAAAAVDPFKPTAMAGPFPTIEALCAAQPATQYGEDCTCKAADTSKVKRALAAPFVQVEAIEHACRIDADHTPDLDDSVAVKTAAGWFSAPAGSVFQNDHCGGALALTGANVRKLATGAELVVTWSASGDCEGNHGSSEWLQTDLQIIGGAHTLSTTPTITITKHETQADTAYDDKAPRRVTTQLALDLAWGADGTVTISGNTTGLDKDAAASLLGKHVIVFP